LQAQQIFDGQAERYCALSSRGFNRNSTAQRRHR
jgi:hypothetical protein